MEVFVIRYIFYSGDIHEQSSSTITEMFYDEVKFNVRLTELQNDTWFRIKDIKAYSGYIPRIIQ